MAQSTPLLLRIVGASLTAASRAGKIVCDVMSKGDLGIVEKVIDFTRLYKYYHNSLMEISWLMYSLW